MCGAIPSGRALFASEPSQPRVFVSAHSGNDPYRNVVSDGQGEPFPLEPAEQHQGLCPCHPALAAEGSGARGGEAAPHSQAEAVSGGRRSRVRSARASVRRNGEAVPTSRERGP